MENEFAGGVIKKADTVEENWALAAMHRPVNRQSSCARLFIEQIDTVNRANHPMELRFHCEARHIASAA